MKVLFVCTGNVCRSPLAEHFFRRLATGIECASAGLAAEPGRRPVAKTLQVAREFGLDLSRHTARPFDPGAVTAADQVLVMEVWQAERVRALTRLPDPAVRLLGELLGEGAAAIADPEDGPEAVFTACAQRIEAAVSRLAAELV